MKRKHLYSIMLLSSLALTTGCDWRKPEISATDEPRDSINIAFKDTTIALSPVEYKFSGVLPKTQNKALLRIMTEWINESLGGKYVQAENDSPESIISYYRKAWCDSAIATVREFSTGDMEAHMPWSNLSTIDIVGETEKYISLYINTYSYAGGAHGSTIVYQQTFRKEDGREFGWNNMFTQEGKMELKELLKQGVMRYFKTDSEQELKKYIFNGDDIYSFPLPATPPVFTQDGINFIYQQYEIAPYAAGMPEVTLSYDEVKPLMNSSAAALLE